MLHPPCHYAQRLCMDLVLSAAPERSTFPWEASCSHLEPDRTTCTVSPPQLTASPSVPGPPGLWQRLRSGLSRWGRGEGTEVKATGNALRAARWGISCFFPKKASCPPEGPEFSALAWGQFASVTPYGPPSPLSFSLYLPPSLSCLLFPPYLCFCDLTVSPPKFIHCSCTPGPRAEPARVWRYGL